MKKLMSRRDWRDRWVGGKYDFECSHYFEPSSIEPYFMTKLGGMVKDLGEAFEKSIECELLRYEEYIPLNDQRESGLCNLFIKTKCVECPVMKHTGKPYCYGTSYECYSELWGSKLDKKILEMIDLLSSIADEYGYTILD